MHRVCARLRAGHCHDDAALVGRTLDLGPGELHLPQSRRDHAASTPRAASRPQPGGHQTVFRGQAGGTRTWSSWTFWPTSPYFFIISGLNISCAARGHLDAMWCARAAAAARGAGQRAVRRRRARRGGASGGPGPHHRSISRGRRRCSASERAICVGKAAQRQRERAPWPSSFGP